MAMALIRRAYGELAKYRGAVELGWYDFRMGYRRSLLGPVWIGIQFCVWLGALTLILHRQLGDGPGSYAIYVATGMAVWEPLVGAMTDGARHFSQHAPLMKNVPVALSHLSVRRLAFLVFRAAVTAPIVIAVLIFFGPPIKLDNLILVVPALALLVLTMYSIIVLFGFIGAYHRDFEFFIPAVARFLFFVTPIFWQATEGVQKAISLLNPFTYYLDIVRGPLIGVSPPLSTWIIVGTFTAIGFLASLVVQANFRRSVIFWI